MATSVDVALVAAEEAEGDGVGVALAASAPPRDGDGEAEEGATVAEADDEPDADADSSPPPSTNNRRPPATAAGADGPRARGASHAASPDARSTATTSSRPTTIASDPVKTGAGIPLMCVVSPMPAGALQAVRYGGPGPRPPGRSDRRPLGTAATGRVTSPRTRAPPRTWPRRKTSEASNRGVRKARHPTRGRQRRRSVERREPDHRGDRRRQEIGERIGVGPVDPHTEMEVRHRQVGMTPTRGGDGLSANHAIALADEDRGEPRVRARAAPPP